MKNVLLLLIAFTIQLIPQENSANALKEFDRVSIEKSELNSFVESPKIDAVYRARPKCRWWRKKYKTKAKIKENGYNWSRDNDKGCKWAKSYIRDQDVCKDYRVIAAYAEAQAGDNMLNFAVEYVNDNCDWSAGTDVDFQTPKFSVLPMYNSLKDKDSISSSKVSGAEISNNEVFFNSDHILIDAFSLSLSANPKDFKNYYSVGMLTIEEALADSLDDQGKVYWSAKAFIYNGELILEGGFKVMDNLKVNRVARGSYELSIDEIRINLSDITNS
ncbi:MAG: hypothetical protein ACPHVP_07335, partial [Flavobacteriales bacterium]